GGAGARGRECPGGRRGGLRRRGGRRVDHRRAELRSEMRALLAPAAGCGLGRAPPATVRPVRVQRRGPRRAEEIRVSETGGGKATAPPVGSAGCSCCSRSV